MSAGTDVGRDAEAVLARRLRPLRIAVGLQGMVLWVPVEKLFMTQIGFTPASVGVMAAAYAAVVPLLEIPSGILADRWSRSWVLVCATVALLASTALGGLSEDVPTYIAAAMLLGVYFALNSGTVDSVVYDSVLEETGSSDRYEAWIGKVRMVESAALVVSALAGGALAGWTSARLTYFATLPFLAVAALAYLRFDEPRLHRAAEPMALRGHLALTMTALLRRPDVRRVAVLCALAGLLSQAVFEFGPLWLVALDSPAAVYGPYWAALVGTLGVGGYLTSRLNLGRTGVVVALAGVGPVAAVVLALVRSTAAVIAAQVVLALLLAVLAIHAGRLLHDAVPSGIRTGLASGVGTLSWLLFLPFSVFVGWLSRESGVWRSGWVFTAVAVLVGVLLVLSARRSATVAATAVAEPASTPADLACRELVELVTDYLDGVLPAEWRDGFEAHLTDCDGCTEYVRQIRLTIQALGAIPREPGPGHPG